MSLEAVDRGFTELLRREVVRKGYLPDVTLYATATDYAQAKGLLQESLPDKTLIEVFGVGTAQSRQEKTACKITVDRKSLDASQYVIADRIVYRWDSALQKYRKIKCPGAFYDIDYEIRTVSNTTKFDRIMSNLVLSVLHQNTYIQYFGEGFTSKDVFAIDFLGCVDISPNEQWLERIYRYKAKAIAIDEETEVAQVPPLLEVNVDIVPAKRTADFGDTAELERLYQESEEYMPGPEVVVPTPPIDRRFDLIFGEQFG